MALRNIVKRGDPCLEKHCRPVTDFNQRFHTLLDDMRETLAKSQGVGLAAPQVGVLKRAVIVLETNHADDEDDYMIELINPEITEVSGNQAGPEGCLSVPGVYGYVERPERVKVRAQDRFGNWFEVEGEGLTARAFCHELDHLDGILYTDRATEMFNDRDEYNRKKAKQENKTKQENKQ